MRESAYSKHDSNPEFWFNLKTLKVEIGPQSSSKNRIGPFSSAEEAAQALKLINDRSTQWRSEDDAEDR